MDSITEPTLLLDEQICKNNIHRMAQKARDHGLQFKPHMKTHQSAEIGQWLREAGTEAITVSSLAMAQYFAKHGWTDITIAFPCNIRQAESINRLAEQVELTLLINSTTTARALQQKLTTPVEAYIEIDTGSQRTGLRPSQQSLITELIRELQDSSLLHWKGFYSHPGHSYNTRSEQEIQHVHQSTISQCQDLRDQLEPTFGAFEICIGDTPCCTKGNNFDAVDAISPGNFVFYDLMQHQIGSCTISDIAVAMACPVVDRYPERLELAIHGGAIHFSKEKLSSGNHTHFGMVASAGNSGWELADADTFLKRLSQEHGIVQCSPSTFDSYSIGDLLTILPVHSCLTANLMSSYRSRSAGKQMSQMA